MTPPLRASHPEVLVADYLPPVPVGRQRELRQLIDELDVADPARERPLGLVRGPPGSGTSTLARLAVRELVQRARASPSPRDPVPVFVRTRWHSSTQGVAAALLRSLDAGFSPRGFSVAEILAGFVRRLARADRPALVVLDDLGPSCPPLEPIVRALLQPHRFLPEGSEAFPGLALLLAGRHEATSAWSLPGRLRITPASVVELAPYSPSEVRTILLDRARRALAREPLGEWVEEILRRGTLDGAQASSVIDRLRRALVPRGLPGSPPQDPMHPVDGFPPVEPRVLRALEHVAWGSTATLAEVRHWEQVYAEEEGVRPLPATTLWRRLVRLESTGWLRRDVRSGGAGGTLSRLELVRPLREWGVGVPPRTPRVSDAPSSERGPWAAAPPPPSAWALPGGPASGSRRVPRVGAA